MSFSALHHEHATYDVYLPRKQYRTCIYISAYQGATHCYGETEPSDDCLALGSHVTQEAVHVGHHTFNNTPKNKILGLHCIIKNPRVVTLYLKMMLKTHRLLPADPNMTVHHQHYLEVSHLRSPDR